jgi:outer membrane protein assembly factor BamB
MRYIVLLLLACAALRADAPLAWRVDLGHPITAAPVVKDGCLFIGAYDGVWHARDARTGDAVWRFAPKGTPFVWATAAVGKGVAVLGGGDGIIYGCDVGTGTELWRVRTGGVIAGGATIAGDTAYIGAMDGALYAITLATGKVRWRARAWWRITAAPAVDLVRGVCYATAEDGRLYAFTTKDGTQLWATKLADAAGPTGPPTVAGDRVLAAADPGTLCCVKASTGAILWRADTGASEAGCVVTGGTVIAGTRDGVAAFALDTGAPRWAFRDRAPVSRGTPVVGGAVVYFTSRNGAVYAVALATGTLAWRAETGGPIDGSPALAGGLLFVTSTDGTISAFRLLEQEPRVPTAK